MKKIILSLSIVAIVAVAASVATVSYFSDTETSENNTFTTGTIDIAVGDENPWESNAEYSFSGLEPSDDEDINVTLSNVGTNDVVVWKKVSVSAEADSVQSEPECDAIGGTWSGSACSGGISVDDLSTQFVYSMDIGGSTNIDQAWDVRVSDINNLWIPIGRLDSGDTLAIDQNYYFDEMAGNEYQGDEMTIDITFYAEQLNAPGPAYVAGSNGVIVENKDALGDWAPIVGDGTWGILTWDGSGNFTMKGWGLAGSSYRAVYYDGSSETNIGSGNTAVSGGAVNIIGTYGSFGANTDAKYWLRDAGYNNSNTLWESNLVNN